MPNAETRSRSSFGIRHSPLAIDRRSWLTAGLLLLTIVYAILQVGFVRPYLPVDPRPNLARPPVLAPGDTPSLEAWRDTQRAGPGATPTWQTDSRGWARAHLGMVVQVIVFTVAAIVLLVLRSRDLTAQLSVLALALSGVAGGGPMRGAELVFPFGTWKILTVFTWLAGPLAFPIIALAILYFPSPSPLLKRYRWLKAVPFLAASPMLLLATATSLYLVGVEAMRDLALWDAAHPAAYYGSFALALGINVAAIVEGVYRYRYNHDANERRRIRVAVYTAVPGVFGYVLKDGVPIAAMLAGAPVMPSYPWPVTAFLQFMVLLPAFGLTYAVGVARVLGPALVLRRSIQYALASRALALIAVLPGAALIYALLQKNLREIITSGSVVYLLLFVATLGVVRYRVRARQWLDLRFFREEYDARKILVSLAGRVRFETDPRDLASLVVDQIDQALHPEVTAMLASGIEDGRLVAVTARNRAVEPVALDGGLVTMLRWSDEPLEIFRDDPRSPARRLPPAEIEWLEKTQATVLVPVLGQDRALVGALVLGEKLSEEAYSAEDLELLSSIAAQVGLGLDVARLRSGRGGTEAATALLARETPQPPMMECPRCGRCEETGTALCPADGATLKPGPIPRLVDDKYRIEQLLGRGGMGAVYRARDTRLDRLVAVKVVRPELLEDQDARRRFRREAQIVARLQHPGIVSIFDFGTLTPRPGSGQAGGGAYLVMELVRGEDLRRVLHREGRLEPARAVKILTAVCAAIEAAHQQGVLHRDLKPENILLPGGEIEAKVLDFGVAKLVADAADVTQRWDSDQRDGTLGALTMAGTIVGTPAYMAPEQLSAAALDARTDVFALGVIAYEMLCGDLPFSRGSLTDVILAQARGVQPLTERDPDIPAALDRAVRRALEMTPDDRPATPYAFASEVLQALAI
jgi:tRNA A-37 threonylcarbamoyl transferase component Bud32